MEYTGACNSLQLRGLAADCSLPKVAQHAMCLRILGMLQVQVKVALKPMVQGVSGPEEALDLIEYIGACSSLQLRGLVADYGLPKVGPELNEEASNP